MPQYWYIVEALVALAANGKKPFTRADLRAWSDKLRQRPSSTFHALDHLEASGLIARRKPESPVDHKPGLVHYALTAEGRAAAVAAAAERARMESVTRELSEPGSFALRVFTLLRMRRMLTGPEAAATLVDAGADVKAHAKRASALLKSWSQLYPDEIKQSEQRIDGAVRYVLVKDIHPQAIPTAARGNKKTARGGATA